MENGERFLQHIQGLLVYLQKKNGVQISLNELLSKDEGLFEIMLEDYEANYLELVGDHIEGLRRQNMDFIDSTIHNYLASFGPSLLTAPQSVVDKKYNEILTYIESFVFRMKSDYQNLSYFATVIYLLDELLKVAPEIEKPPVIGTVSTENINACILKLESEEVIIIVEEDILSFIHLFSKIFVLCMSLEEKGDKVSLSLDKETILTHIKENPEIEFRFKDLLEASIIERSPRKSEQYNLKMDARYQFCTEIMMSAESFLIAHELGHLLAGHLTVKKGYGYYQSEMDASVDKTNWEKEYEADRIGVNLVAEFARNRNVDIAESYIGIELFFIMYDIVLKAKKILKEGNEDISNNFSKHPSNLSRRQNTRKEVMGLLGSSTPQEFYTATFFPDVFEQIMEYLWSNTKHIFYTEFERRKLIGNQTKQAYPGIGIAQP